MGSIIKEKECPIKNGRKTFTHYVWEYHNTLNIETEEIINSMKQLTGSSLSLVCIIKEKKWLNLMIKK